MENRGGLEFMRVSASTSSPRGRYEDVAMLWNVSLSQEDAISPAPVTTTEEKGVRNLESALAEQREECSVVSVSL